MECFKLTNETIDMLSDRIGEVYSGLGSSKKDTYRAKLILEEALLKYQSRFGEDIDIYFRTYHVFSQTRFCVRLRAPSFDPFTLEENPMAFMIQSVMSSFEGAMPTWKYHNLENEIVFTLRKKAAHSTLFKIATSIAVSLAVGIGARFLLPQETVIAFVNNYVEPFSNAYAGLFCVMAVLISLFAITLSIVHIGDMAAVGAIGGRIVRRFYTVSALVVLALTLPLLPFFDLSGSGAFTLAAKSIYDILISFVPTNMVGAFMNFNSVHIMIIGAMFGFSLLTMGQRGEDVVRLFDQCNMVANLTNDFINRFVFIYVGMKIFAIVTLSEFSALAGAARMVVVIVAAELLLLGFYTLYAAKKSKMTISEYVKVMMPSFAICLSSANCGAAASTIFDTLEAMDVDESLNNMGSSIGSVVFQPASTLVFIISALFMASSFGVEISLVWVIMAMLLSILLVAAIPSIPGAAVSVFTLLYSQLGLPAEALSLMIAINAVLQFLTVGVDVWCLQSEIICLSRSGRLTKEKAA